jgi:hypothetical protein
LRTDLPLPVPNKYFASGLLAGYLLYRYRYSIIRVQRLPVRLKQLLGWSSTGQDERLAGEAGQRVAVAAVGGQTHTKADSRYGWVVEMPVRVSRVDRVRLQNA